MELEPGKFPLDDTSHQILVNNLLNRNKEFTPETVDAGKKWYSNYQEDAEHLGQKMGRDTLAGASAIAALSPQTDWEKNRMQGLQLLDISDKQSARIRHLLNVNQNFPEDKLSKVDAKFKEEFKGTPLGFQNVRNIGKALKIRDNEVANPLDVLPSDPNYARKTTDFAIGGASGGKEGLPVMDTHAHDAALDEYNIHNTTGNKFFKKKGTYNFVQQAYVAAHAHALRQGLIPSDTTVHQYQAMHWVHQLSNKVLFNKNAATSAKVSDTVNANLISNNPQWNPEAQGLRPVAFRAKHLAAFKLGAQQ